MGGEIKVVKKEGPGTLMRLCLLLSAPMDVTEQHCEIDLIDNALVKKGVRTMEASEWNLFHARSSLHNNDFDPHYPINEGLKSKILTIKDMRNPIFVIVVDIGLLDLSTDISKEQLNFLHRYKAGMNELVVLKKLVGADPEDKRHCVHFLSSFKYINHLCLIFESLNMNLREVLKKFGRNIGLRLTAVRAYAKQLFIALKHLRSCGVLHCDLRVETNNMLVMNMILMICLKRL